MTSKDIAEKNELEFQRAYSKWEASKHQDKKSYEQMFFCMKFAAENLIKSKLKVFRDDVEELALDLTMLVFERDIIKRHIRPQKLSSYLYLPMQGIVHSHQLQFEEKVEVIEPTVEKKTKSYEEEITTDKLYVIYNKIYKKQKDIKTSQEVVDDMKERDSVKVQTIITEDMINNPDFVMSLFGWEFHN